MKYDFRIAACLVFAILLWARPISKSASGQTTKDQHQVEFQNSLKVAEARFRKSVQEAQARYLEDIKRAQSILDSRVAERFAKTENPFEKIVTVSGAKPGPVTQGRDNLGWYEIPEMMRTAVIFTPTKDQPHNGVVQFVVNKNTRIGLAASWAYDGNPSGGWQEERKSKAELEKLGWVEKGEMYLNLYDRHTLFVRDCEKGERISIRTRKYNPPFVFVLNAIEPGKKEKSAQAKRDVVIEVAASEKMDAVDLIGKEQIPEVLIGSECFISPLRGVALVKAHRMCEVYVAASWKYDGNSSGQWTEERWTEATFEEKGWKEIGSIKIKHRGSMQDHKLYSKVLNEGDELRIRTRKYGAPFVFAAKVSPAESRER